MTASCWALGDPQTTYARFLETLDRARLLEDGRRLRRGVRLLSMGDHFDFAPPPGWSQASVSTSGEQILSWLSEHPPEQVTILLGNHDVSRVMELYRMTDAEFTLARKQSASSKLDKSAFFERFPDLPSPGIAGRDYSAFRVSQREQVQQLLLSGRAKLACVVETPEGDRGLATHAGVTLDELRALKISGERDPARIARRLNALLSERVEAVRGAWERGEAAPLDLSPLHRTGRAGQEGGGLLYKRPQTAPFDDWDAGGRRFHPRRLPPGLLQICGHTHHKKCRELMPDEAGPLSVEAVGGRLRSISVRDKKGVRYAVGLTPPRPGQATLWMTDGRMNHSDRVELLRLNAVYSDTE